MPAPASLKTAIAIRHVHFEDLGTFEGVLASAGYVIHYYDVGEHELWTLDPLLPDLLVVLGGPVGVYDDAAYPFLREERQLLGIRLAAGRPTLGICLGAQLIAAALGATVAPMGHKEIGFGALALADAAAGGPLGHLEDVPVLHWHGDAFEVPEGAVPLASTPRCATQAFSIGPNVLALQFHPEADAGGGLQRWLVGHAAELAAARIDVARLREEAVAAGPALRDAARRMLSAWLQALEP